MSESQQRPRVRVAAIIKRDDSVLMVRHEKGQHTYWLLPGGGVDYGESLIAALERELREECCVNIEVGEFAFVIDAISIEEGRHLVQMSFEAKIREGDPVLGTDESVVEVKFVPISDLEALNIHPPVNSELMEGLRNGFAGQQRYLGNRWLTE